MLARLKLIRTEVLISKTLIDSNISHDKFVSKNNVLKEFNKMKEEIKKLKVWIVYKIFQSIYKTTSSYCYGKKLKVKILKFQWQKMEE